MSVCMKSCGNVWYGLKYDFVFTFCSCCHIKHCIKTENYVGITKFWLCCICFLEVCAFITN